ncbi:MAG: glycosyl hydrolase [Proteobacteria bacterium]|nr:glycosyl hydrolase [Pseudomonadota bacterium]
MNGIVRTGLFVFLMPLLALAQDEEATEPGFNEATFSGLEFRSIGPALMSGRIADIAIDPTNPSTWYVGVGSGGVWKTENGGTTWTPVFDGEDTYSIGCITLDPNNPSTIWVGTGENISGRHVGYGAGVYRSRDGGITWENMGLTASEHIGMIRVDPRDSNTVYVASQGPLWSGGGERGLYKSTDGGQSWDKILGDGLGNTDIDDQYTGVSEVHLDPRNPDVVYAVSWQRFRNVAVLLDGGPGSGIHKSTDGGATWRELTEGLPKEDKGKIGLAISPQNPDVVYATIELAHREGGFFRSEDGGESWEKQNDYLSGGTGPHYYQEIFASPHKFDRVYQMDVHLHTTENGGRDFVRTSSDKKHTDHHAMAFHPTDEDYLLVGNDGGVYESVDLGETWRFIANMPVTQFYKVSVDYDEPFYNVFGGTQDNSSFGGPSRTNNVIGIRNEDWYLTLGADGHQSAADPTNPNIIYANWQEGNLTRYDHSTGESVYIKPLPAAGEEAERVNWDAPILISPHNPQRLYHATHRVWRSDNRGDSWQAISGDLTRNEERLQQPLMERRWSFDAIWDLSAMSRYNTITSLSESPLVAGLLYAGTDDGLIQISEDGGTNWRRVDSLPGVPDNFFVNDIKADLHDADSVYIVVDDHKSGDYSPYILKSENRGKSWRSIAANLPERDILWRVVQDHVNPSLLFVGTETGVFFTVNAGGQWTRLSGGAPTIAFRDLVIQTRENDLVGATFGRSFYILDDYSPLRNITIEILQNDTVLFPVRRAHWYVQRRPLSCARTGCVDSQGHSYFVASNPAFGANFTYYLPERLRSLKEQRQEDEREQLEQNEDVDFPSWDRVDEEEREDAPAIILTVSDSDGNVIRHIEGPVEAGFHRVAWDLRYPAVDPWTPEEERNEFANPTGVLVAPGTYQVAMYQRVGGELMNLGQSEQFEVVSIREPTLPGSSQEQRIAFSRQVDEMQRAVSGTLSSIDEVLTQLDAIKETLQNSTADMAFYAQANSLQQRISQVRDRLRGNETRGSFSDPGLMPVRDRLRYASYDANGNAYGPTRTQRDSFAIAGDAYAEIGPMLTALIENEYQALKRALDAAGVPWTPGRGVLRPN